MLLSLRSMVNVGFLYLVGIETWNRGYLTLLSLSDTSIVSKNNILRLIEHVKEYECFINQSFGVDMTR